ncbi:hypothetical protein L6164_008305 [Bauhinia variegata]|uniref:Uncharacterized protein n=1 Tax=Bauhinia variegata TaxID=167791 RepID=A0ACB9PLU7_BAUVA|nr:hypothetical protein L6164_008305 [Bauhinia variegata]
MGCKLNSISPQILCKFHTKNPKLRTKTNTIILSSSGENLQKTISPSTATKAPKLEAYTVGFKTQRACKLGISRYPDFEYNAEGERELGLVDLEFKAKFLFSAGSVYKAPPLLVKTLLTSEESKGTMKSGRGKRLDAEGKCRLVGVATVDPIDDFFLNSFLALPTECLADLNALISISGSS